MPLRFAKSMAKKKSVPVLHIYSNLILYYSKVSGFTSDSKLHCPECDKEISVGTGGKANLQQHIGLRTCQAAISSRWQQNIPSIHSFFGPNIPQNPPTTSTPPLLHSTVQAVSSSTNRFESATVSWSSMCHDVPGELIQLINPEFLYKDGKAMYLLDSNFLLTVTADLLNHLTHQSHRGVPMVSWTNHFPYRLLGKACFISDHEVQDGVKDLEEKSVCSRCGSKTHVVSSKTQHVSEHMGPHILYDSTNLWNQEVCGLCLRPAPMCQIYMKKAGVLIVTLVLTPNNHLASTS